MDKKELYLLALFLTALIIDRMGIDMTLFINLYPLLFISFVLFGHKKNPLFIQSKKMYFFQIYCRTMFYIALVFLYLDYPGKELIGLVGISFTLLFLLITFFKESYEFLLSQSIVYLSVIGFLSFIV